MTQQELNDIVGTIGAYKNSREYKAILTQSKYYSNEVYASSNEVLYNNKIFFYEDGEDILNHNDEKNKKLSVSFFRKLVDQKINYLLGNPMNLECDEVIKTYFTPHLYKAIHAGATDAVKHGQGWIMAYYTQDANLRFKYVPANEVYPVWKDYDRTILDKVYRFYNYNGSDYIYIYSAETGITKIENGVVVEESLPMVSINNKDHFFMPFIYLDYNYERISLLNFVKDLIDDYNEQLSSRANNLLNITKSIKVVKNYDGTSLREADRRMNMNRIIGVAEGGDVKVIQVPIESVAVEDQLDQLVQNIYDAGRGVNFARENLGNSSGVALKFKYSDLDADTDNMSMYFKEGIDKIVEFISQDLALKGINHSKQCSISFNKNRIINETEVVDNLTKLQGILSRETIIKLLPWDIDVKSELKLIAQEESEAMKEEYNYEGYGVASNNNSSGSTIEEVGSET